jgi:uncharacterized protein (TIGR03086 family)
MPETGPYPANLVELHRRAVDGFGQRVDAIRDDQWGEPTPCSDWDVRALVNHLVNENRWTPPLMEGRTIEDVGDRFDGDLLGDDPHEQWADASAEALAAVGTPGALDRTVHLSFGDTPAVEYVMQLTADHLIHAWDLARAIGADERLDPEIVAAIAAWFAPQEDGWRGVGIIGPRPPVPDGADEQTRLLAGYGRKA